MSLPGMAPLAIAGSLRVGLSVSLLFLSGCLAASTRYGTHHLKSECSLFGICGPYSRTWLADDSGKELLSVSENSVSPDQQWLVLFDSPASRTLHLLDVRRDRLREIPTGAYLVAKSARWSPDGTKLALLKDSHPTRLCVVSLSEEPSVEWQADDPRDPSKLEIEWRDGTARITAR